MAADTASNPRSSADLEAAKKEEGVTTEERHVPTNTDILAETWSRRALIVAFTGLVLDTILA